MRPSPSQNLEQARGTRRSSGRVESESRLWWQLEHPCAPPQLPDVSSSATAVWPCPVCARSWTLRDAQWQPTAKVTGQTGPVKQIKIELPASQGEPSWDEAMGILAERRPWACVARAIGITVVRAVIVAVLLVISFKLIGITSPAALSLTWLVGAFLFSVDLMSGLADQTNRAGGMVTGHG